MATDNSSDGSATAEPERTIARFPGPRVEQARILWIGAGDFFRRVVENGSVDYLLKNGASLTVVDVKSEDDAIIQRYCSRTGVEYFNAS